MQNKTTTEVVHYAPFLEYYNWEHDIHMLGIRWHDGWITLIIMIIVHKVEDEENSERFGN